MMSYYDPATAFVYTLQADARPAGRGQGMAGGNMASGRLLAPRTQYIKTARRRTCGGPVRIGQDWHSREAADSIVINAWP